MESQFGEVHPRRARFVNGHFRPDLSDDLGQDGTSVGLLAVPQTIPQAMATDPHSHLGMGGVNVERGDGPALRAPEPAYNPITYGQSKCGRLARSVSRR